MSNLWRVKLARVFSTSIFCAAIGFLYLQSRGLPDPIIYSAYAFSGISTALLEFPTGVISDYFSQVLSLKLGYLFLGLGFVLLAQRLEVWGYFLAQFTIALGMSLASGSDVAVLSQYSEDFAKDTKQVKILTQIALVGATVIGGFLFAKLNYLPTLLTGLFYWIAFLLVLTLKDKENNEAKKIKGNVFGRAKEGIEIVMRNSQLRDIILIAGFMLGFEISFKFTLNELFLGVGIPGYIHGTIIGALSLVVILGIAKYKDMKSKRNVVALILFPVFLIAISVFQNMYGVLISLLGWYIAKGLCDTYFEIEINDKVPQSNKASVMSLRSLISRGFSSLYSFLAGFIIVSSSLPHLVFYTGIFFVIVVALVGYNKYRYIRYSAN